MDEGATRGNRYLLAGLVATLILWNIPYGGYALYPFKIFATWLHESSHGVTMLLTGAGLDRLQIYRDTSGLAVPERGVTTFAQAAISSAGYMGTALIGGVLLVLGRTPPRARRVLAALAALMALSAIVWVSNGFGRVAILVGAAGLAAGALLASEGVAAFLLNFLAAQACINAVLDIRVLFSANLYVNGQPHQQSDAHAMARLTGLPGWLWAVVWLVWSFALFYLALRWARLRAPARAPAATVV